ncbi:MAG: hypothetical protein WAU81_02775 [Candidatus Aminicenantales bacterium]
MTSLDPRQRLKSRRLEKAVFALTRKRTLSSLEERRLGDACRDAVRLYRDVVSGRPLPDGKDVRRLAALAHRAMLTLGGEGDIRGVSLRDYDSGRFGPYLGVSDEGSAAGAILKAALNSPKVRALGEIDPMSVGVALDAERLGGIGEVAVGPEEYADVRTACLGRILNSTNIGTRVNLRLYRRHPVVWAADGPYAAALERAKADMGKKFAPFLRPPGGKARPLTVYAGFPLRNRCGNATRIAFLKELDSYLREGKIADPLVHNLGYQASIQRGQKGKQDALRAIRVAAGAGLKKVALCGNIRRRAEEQISQPGLLNYLPAGKLGPVLREAAKRRVRVKPINTVDPGTVARHVWSGLQAARRMGFELGKYGLFPLTLEESEVVVGQVQKWYKDWSAAPVFFVDQGLLSETHVDSGRDIIRGLKTWLRMVARYKVQVVLIDTVEKAKCPPLLKTPANPKGLMSVRQVQDIDALARSLGIKTLWAGSISLPQAYDLGRVGVFGIYVTSAAAEAVPVPPGYEDDYWLAAVKEPTYKGVYRTKLLLEAGFLAVRVPEGRRIAATVAAFIAALPAGDEAIINSLQEKLAQECTSAWRRFLGDEREKRTSITLLRRKR